MLGAQVTSYTPGAVNAAVACFLFGLMALMHVDQQLFERQRTRLTLLMRIIRSAPADGKTSSSGVQLPT